MKKKIKDLTLEQIGNFECIKKKLSCSTCPFYDEANDSGKRCFSAEIGDIMIDYPAILEKEVEVDESNSN